MSLKFNKHLLRITQSTEATETKVIQSLWSDYGKISRYRLQGSPSHDTVVVKHIALGQSTSHPRGWNTDRSHQRKVKSYAVETHWYAHWNHRCESNCRTAAFIGSFREGEDQWIILEDLDANFPLRRQDLQLTEVKACLSWLAHFHATHLESPPAGLWEVGTYWHLATRPDEFEKIEHRELKSKAQAIDEALNTCRYRTIVHGDAKLANFCFSRDGKEIAAVDFQYVGGGCGMKDVAYFLGSCLSSEECTRYQDELLDFYFSTLERTLGSTHKSIRFKELETEWRSMYPLACTDFTRFLLGWMPGHQKINRYHLDIMKRVLAELRPQ